MTRTFSTVTTTIGVVIEHHPLWGPNRYSTTTLSDPDSYYDPGVSSDCLAPVVLPNLIILLYWFFFLSVNLSHVLPLGCMTCTIASKKATGTGFLRQLNMRVLMGTSDHLCIHKR